MELSGLPPGVEIIDSDQRVFDAYAAVEIYDSKGQLVPIASIIPHMDAFMDMGGILHDKHTYKVIGKALRWNETNLNGAPAIKIRGKIYDFYPLHDEIWGKIQSGEYTGVSIGGEGVLYDAGVLKLEGGLFEISPCKKPANPGAKIVAISVAKSDEGASMEDTKKADVKKEAVKAEPEPPKYKTLTVSEAENGYEVSSYSGPDGKEFKRLCDSLDMAKATVDEVFGKKKTEGGDVEKTDVKKDEAPPAETSEPDLKAMVKKLVEEQAEMKSDMAAIKSKLGISSQEQQVQKECKEGEKPPEDTTKAAVVEVVRQEVKKAMDEKLVKTEAQKPLQDVQKSVGDTGKKQVSVVDVAMGKAKF